ncbi:hypothetical protein CHS0354_028715 [Potamilus streckersoni]|uniref:protein-tyrosine-phosphatase n=1 Tax=Potamilus streckersoni TaxID=2493646 RepID=A0AAE0SYG7_9BIVA|nr:hypothetical protein CHS0354_028715 [Potamilus streckersoni]
MKTRLIILMVYTTILQIGITGDIAFRKPANQSSPNDPQISINPSSVVDGNYTTCSNVTKGTNGMWWEVDLGKKYRITGFVITMREIYSNQPFQVEVKNSSVSFGRYCVSDGGFTPSNGEIQISCTDAIYGSIVRISSLNSQTWAMLCDLRIFGGRNLAYRRNSTQSSTRYVTGTKTDGWAELGMDGGTNANFTYGSCTHTNGSTDNSPLWWRVDLGHQFFINQMHIVNRQSLEDRLLGFKVKFWNKSTATIVYNALNSNPGLYIDVTNFSSSLGDSIFIELSGGTTRYPRYINLCEVFVYGDCLVNQCGWECEKSCYCKSAIVGSDKIEGICPDEDCLVNWTGTNRRCDYCLYDGQGKCPHRCNICETGSYCFPETATCLPICDERYWGLNCSRHCGNCIRGNKCNQVTGRCPGQCQVGWWDKNCSSLCSFCKNGTNCDKDSGKCEICEDGKWGLKCDKTCGNCINRKCDITVGVCEDGCINGWWDGFCNQSCYYCENGTKCHKDSGKCETCEDGKWGVKCHKTCGNCINRKCNITVGVCEDRCINGWWDGFCNQSCDYCENGTKCDKDSGKCETCEDGKWGLKCDKTCGNCINRKCNITVGVCEDGCKNGWWGGFCNQSCNYCGNGTKCDKESGNCMQCPTGKWNKKCSQNCTYCAQDTECNIENGECKECPNGRWGSRCRQSCEYCAQGTECDIRNGNCLQCDAGNWSLNCSLKCGQCFGDGVCDIKTSKCIHGCHASWQGDNCTTVAHQMTQEATNKGVVIGVSTGTVLMLGLVVVIIVFLVIRKRRENILKSKLDEKSIQQSEENNSVIYANIDGRLEKQTKVNRAQDYANIIHTNGNYDANSGGKQEKKHEVDTDHKNNQITQSSSLVEDVYYNGVGVNKSQILLSDLPDYVRSKAYFSNDLESEFQKLPKNPQSSMTIAQLPVNAKKNRYKGLYAYDNTRVELPQTADISGSDYINACFIKGFEKDRAYIASQGPTDVIVDDFWRMIWHYKVDKIVMLTELVEETKMKCIQYWPSEGKCTYGSTEVEYLTEDVYADYTIRKFKIHQAGEKCRIVTKFHFTAWPDRGVPETPSSLVQLWSKVRNTVRKADTSVLVHCSAGVGRTGTFIALDYLYDEGKHTGSVNVFACICELRKQRVNMVQTKEQYVYLHEAVVEALMPTMASVPSVTFHEKYTNLLRPDRRTGQCLLHTEFEMLKEDESLRQRRDNLGYIAKEPENDFTDASHPENRKKNRYEDIFPASRYRPMLLKYNASDNDYINAVIMPSHKSKNAFLLTQTPLPNTVEDFLRLVLDNNVHTIIVFDNEITKEEKVGMYWPLTGDHAIYGQVQVDVESTGHTDTHTYRLLNLTHLQTGEVFTVKQFICTLWKQSDNTPNCALFLAFLKAIEIWLQKKKSAPTVVHCLNGAERSGLFCVVSTILERLKIDCEVAVSSAIRQMRIRRPQIIPNYEQFKFCHDVVVEFLSHFETYSNFKDI